MTKPLFLYRVFIVISFFILLTGFRLPVLSPASGKNNANYPFHRPNHIALLLPLSGKHAEAAYAIRDGFLAGYYQHTFPGTAKPTIQIYDTAKDPDVQKIYQLAISQGADFIVGPLIKEDVLRLSQLPPRLMAMPILALNNHPHIKSLPPKFMQFALLPEEEAEQIAKKAWANGYRRPGVLVPNTEWGKRMSDAFSRYWQALGGQISQIEFIHPEEDQGAGIRRFLRIGEKQDLKKDPPHFSFDWIMMATDQHQARQLKPLLNFYYAHHIPVYAVSSVYGEGSDPLLDHDLDGVIFCDMPWLLDPASIPPKPASVTNYRLFAMGVDAYQLGTQLSDLQLGGSYTGLTGQLYLSNQQIHRQLTWATMKNGKPVLFR